MHCDSLPVTAIDLHQSLPRLPDLYIEQLPPTEKALVNAFYRGHGSAMKAGSQHSVWALRQTSLSACLCLQPVTQGQWLTGLFVAPDQRRQGHAGRLLQAVRHAYPGPIWLFCKPQLAELYARHGFVSCRDLPPVLADRLQRYQRTKPLIALVNPG